MNFYTADAFTDVPYKGNPAGIMIVKDFPTDAQCHQIASEVNLSETSFIKPLEDDTYHIRWFTPAAEVALCGHATLAASHILFTENIVTQDHISFISLSGPLSVNRHAAGYTLDFPLQPVTETLPLDQFENILDLPGRLKKAVQAHDDIIIELNSVETLKGFVPNYDELATVPCRGLILTAAADEGPYDFVSRFFAPRVGVYEDPVTGSAHCKLADYWQKKLGKTTFKAFQASPRGGKITVEIHGNRVHLTGKAVTIIKGQWQPWV